MRGCSFEPLPLVHGGVELYVDSVDENLKFVPPSASRQIHSDFDSRSRSFLHPDRRQTSRVHLAIWRTEEGLVSFGFIYGDRTNNVGVAAALSVMQFVIPTAVKQVPFTSLSLSLSLSLSFDLQKRKSEDLHPMKGRTVCLLSMTHA